MFWKDYEPSNLWHKSNFHYLRSEGKFSLQTRFATFAHHCASFPVLPEEPTSNEALDITPVTHTL